MAEIFDLGEMIRKALNREVLSRDLYRSWEGKFGDEAANRVIHMLARDEEGHIKMLEMTLEDGNLGRIGKRENKARTAAPPRVPDVAEITPKCTAKELIAYAIHHEDRAVQYYARYMDIFRETPLQEFFTRMKREEEMHKERLETLFLREYAGRKG
ncbi:MAG: hypothetical protein M5R36_22770 [Deltaproteobacteria bacterium]|nr:hypothetical protein [Deltaproteobacteria bacterium]